LRQKLKKRGRESPLFVYRYFSMELGEEIRKLAEQKLTPDQFIVDVVVSARKGPKKVMVIVDGDQGFSIEDCAALSRHLSKALDDTALIDDNYFLEVSTPGVDHPLKLRRQYRKNIGRLLKVKLQDQILEGRLLEVADDRIILEEQSGSGKKKEVKTTEILIDNIEKAFVQVSFK
jgi:ribosome maturation factor RimP